MRCYSSAHSQVDDDAALQIDTSKTWETVAWDDVKGAMAARMMEGEVPLADDEVGMLGRRIRSLQFYSSPSGVRSGDRAPVGFVLQAIPAVVLQGPLVSWV
jgi:hypothetical protein